MRKYRLTIPIFILIFGVILHLVIPGILALIVGFLFSVLMMGDPIYGQERTKEVWAEIWNAVGFFLYIQGRSAFISSTVFGIVTGLLIDKIRSTLVYPAVLAFALVLHYSFTVIFAVSYYLFVDQDISFDIPIASFIVTTIVAFLLGLLAILLKKIADRSGRSTQRNTV